MSTFKFETWDVFTDRRFCGNPLAVVTDAAGLSTEQMQLITREFNLSETTFVLPPQDPANTARVRIFTPGYEMPFAGHPTVGTALAIARARQLSGELRLELTAGLFPVRTRIDAATMFAQFENPNAPAERDVAPDAALIEAALSLAPGTIERESHRPRCVGAGVNFVYARSTLALVRTAALDSAAWTALELDHAVGVLLYAEGGDSAEASYHVRMFAPGAGVFEDPATGSAACALPGQIALSQPLADGKHRWVVEQGFEMGRPSRIEVEFETHAGVVGKVRVGGSAVHVSSGEIHV